MMKKTILTLCLVLSFVHVAFADESYERLDLLFDQNDFKTLEQECLKEIKKSPNSLDAYYFLSVMYLNQHKFDEAKKSIEYFEKYHTEEEKIQTKQQGSPVFIIDAYYGDLYFEIGTIHFENAEYAKAIPWLERAKSFFPDNQMLNFYLGVSYKQTKNFAEAIKFFKRQLEIKPEEPSPYYNIACVYAVQGKTTDAIAWLKKAVKAHPEFKDAAQKDKDFDRIRNTKEFIEIVKQEMSREKTEETH